MRAIFAERAAALGTVRLATLVLVLAGMGVGPAVGPAWSSDQPNGSPKSPVPPQESLQYFQHHPAVRVELVAAEPQVIDPVAIAFDERAWLWVVEMQDYPVGPPDGGPLRSRIRILEDRDGDGYFETAHTFADHLLFPNSLQPWKGGVIVTLSGKVVWMKDTDGDFRADVQETWFTGFTEQNPQLRANHPTFALDNHIYIANGLRGGKVIAVKPEWAKDARPVSISGMDFRFDPRTGQYEAVSGNGQFGLTFDDWGNRFICSNRNPCRHVVLEDRYVRRNPFLAVRSTVTDVAPPGERSHVYPIARAWTTSTLHQGQFTAACAVWIYRGDALPSQFYGNSFTCEPTGYLVHRDILEKNGPTFGSHYARAGVEFLASKDTWCRPVNLTEGPDGALYVVDMYRAVIEHPDFMPDELKHRPDMYDGNDRGRIYRVVGLKHRRPKRPPLDGRSLSELSSAELVRLLACRNAWHRSTAARLLYERQDRSVRPLLEKMALEHPWPAARVQALWTLQGLGVLDRRLVERALQDESPRVREQAVRLLEPWLREDPQREQKLVRQAVDQQDDDRLLFQAALSVGEAGTHVDPEMLADWAWRGKQDPWIRVATLSSLPSGKGTSDLLRRFVSRLVWHVRQQPAEADEATDLVQQVLELVGARQDLQEMAACLTELTRLDGENGNGRSGLLRLQLAALRGLGTGVRRRGRSPLGVFQKLRDVASDSGSSDWQALFERAAELALNERAGRAARLEAVETLQFAPYSVAGPALKHLVQQQADQQLCIAAIASLAKFGNAEVVDTLMFDFLSRTPAVRRAILDAMLASTARTNTLLDMIERGELSASELDLTRTNRLLRHRDPKIRSRAKTLLAAAVPADRKEVIEKYRKALSLKADPYRGREVFQKHCSTCHRIGNIGVNVAPDIADSRTKTPEYLLVAILDPNRAVDNNYFSYTVVTTDGKIYTGIIASETASSVTIRQEENKTVTLLRQDIEIMRSNGVSLMPVGLEKDLTVQDVADVISFIKNWRYLDGSVPLPQFSKRGQ